MHKIQVGARSPFFTEDRAEAIELAIMLTQFGKVELSSPNGHVQEFRAESTIIKMGGLRQ